VVGGARLTPALLPWIRYWFPLFSRDSIDTSGAWPFPRARHCRAKTPLVT